MTSQLDSGPAGTPCKRPRSENGDDPCDGPGRTPAGGSTRSRVRFGMVRIRTHGVEMWGGGGVPADDGPPLGLGWEVEGERAVDLDDFEVERESARTPKDSYCMLGCVEPGQRQEMLLGSGFALKQIRAVTKQVAQLNAERWKVQLNLPAAPLPASSPVRHLSCPESHAYPSSLRTQPYC